ncbi:MAG: hypothetical protein DWQ47_15850 [Acidobacteria bacterium]|nr:MAG: hypothetical protein DWQ32_03250 [Acidobacteriota bacterium]REK02468.1 MAG: hypothetical protein DWQ38_08885 [Acidobacteriota bacterium]REK13730.1 MAG: hypothetical protein DWQ43_08940 [Acidobacteriota bacterium]REK41724.1 MAG: hypothetical protein DWQ47_15850 [Acidobacteriota bacterium]
MSVGAFERQMVMDDGATFFDAEPVKEYDSQLRLNKDIGWYLKSSLRIIGTFPKRSAFRIVVKKDGKAVSEVRCEGDVYTKATDVGLRTEIQRRGRDLNYEDYMTAGLRCFDESAVIKGTGKFQIEVNFVDGDTDTETLVRTYSINVHRATKVRGSATKPQPDVSDYYIDRHNEAAVAIAYFVQSNIEGTYFKKPIDNYGSPTFGDLYIYTTYSPDERSRRPSSPFARCSVNGKRVALDYDRVSMSEDQSRREVGIYTDRLAAQYKRGSAYKDQVEFVGLTFKLPLHFGEAEYSKPPIKVEEAPGDWECSVIANGVTYRTFRFKIDENGLVPHPEQTSGNINLFYKAALIDMEIPAGGSPIDHRLAVDPAGGLFYGIPWTTAEGKAMAARAPRKGVPYHVPSNKAP